MRCGERDFFYNKVNLNNSREMFNYINNHFTYFTMNSWNINKSIANNVKIYNLGLSHDQKDKAYDLLDCENFWDNLKPIIEDWEFDHPNHVVGSNGRMSGYLVLYNKNNYKSCVETDVYGYDNYDDFLSSYKEYGYTAKDVKYMLQNDTKLIQDFDKLCDNLREHLVFMIDNYIISEVTYHTENKANIIVPLNEELTC